MSFKIIKENTAEAFEKALNDFEASLWRKGDLQSGEIKEIKFRHQVESCANYYVALITYYPPKDIQDGKKAELEIERNKK
jgi:hypothetical protein